MASRIAIGGRSRIERDAEGLARCRHAARDGAWANGSALMGVLSSVVARMASPERTIALAILVQLVLGGAGTTWLVPLLPTYGVHVIWL